MLCHASRVWFGYIGLVSLAVQLERRGCTGICLTWGLRCTAVVHGSDVPRWSQKIRTEQLVSFRKSLELLSENLVNI